MYSLWALRLTGVEARTDGHHVLLSSEALLVQHVLGCGHPGAARLWPCVPRDYVCQQVHPFSGHQRLTSAINQSQLLANAIGTKTGPIWDEKDVARFFPDEGPVFRPPRAFESGHQRLAIHNNLCYGQLVAVDERGHLGYSPAPSSHAKAHELALSTARKVGT